VFPVSWIGLLLAAMFSYYVVEQPSLRLRGRLVRSFQFYRSGRKLAGSERPLIGE